MVKIERSVTINRSPARVFDYITTIENSANWQMGLVESQKVTDGPLGVGAQVRNVNQFVGRQIESVFEMTEYEPNKGYAGKTISGPLPLEASYRLVPVEGGTELTYHVEGEIGGFFKIAEPLVRRQAQRQFEANLANLKDILEAQAEVGE